VDGFEHIISDQMAVVTVASKDLAGLVTQVKYNKEMNLLHELIITLNVDWTYTIYVDPTVPGIKSTGALTFYGQSETFVATESTDKIIINCQTDQALVIIEDVNIDPEAVPQVEFYSDNTYTTLEATYGLGKTGNFYAMYVNNLSKGYRFVIKKTDGTTSNVKVYNLVPGLMYNIIVELFPPENTNGSLEIDVDAAFTVSDVIV
jgi:hypothetical protein